MALANLKLSQKIPLYMTVMVLCSAVSVGVANFFQARDTLENTYKHQSELILSEKKQELLSYLDNITDDLSFMSGNTDLINAFEGYEAAWHEFGANQTQILQALYIDNNKNKIGEKLLLDDAGDGSSYSHVHAQFHGMTRTFLKLRGYYDVFLIDNEGNVVYTVFKERDFGTNLKSGQWKDTGLAKTFASASQLPQGEIYFSDFEHYAPSNGDPAAFIATPVYNKQHVRIGVLAFQMPIDKVSGTLDSSDLNASDAGNGTMQLYLVGKDMLLRSDSIWTKEHDVLKTKVNLPAIASAFEGKSGTVSGASIDGRNAYISFAPVKFYDATYALVTELDEKVVSEPVKNMLDRAILLIIGGAIIVSAIGIWLVGRIIRRLNGLNSCMSKLAEGNIAVDVPSLESSDEIGEMARSVGTFKENAIRNRKLEEESVLEVERTQEEKKFAMFSLANRFEERVQGVINSVASSATELLHTAEAMATNVNQVSQKASDVASAAEQTTSNVQTVASAAEEMTASVKEISSQVSKSTQVVSDTVEKAERADEKAKLLEGAAAEIGDVVRLIKDIAEQINLLALNATIESARAGEAGKGFAVVASEVKNLATQTTNATEEIAKQIESIQHISSEVVASLKTIQHSIHNVNEYAGSIASAVEEQSAVTDEISNNMQTAAYGTQSIRNNIGEVSVSSSEAQLMSGQVVEASRMLSREAESLSREVSEFLVEIRNG